MGIILRYVCWGIHRPPPWGARRLTARPADPQGLGQPRGGWGPPPPPLQPPKLSHTPQGHTLAGGGPRAGEPSLHPQKPQVSFCHLLCVEHRGCLLVRPDPPPARLPLWTPCPILVSTGLELATWVPMAPGNFFFEAEKPPTHLIFPHLSHIQNAHNELGNDVPHVFFCCPGCLC